MGREEGGGMTGLKRCYHVPKYEHHLDYIFIYKRCLYLGTESYKQARFPLSL